MTISAEVAKANNYFRKVNRAAKFICFIAFLCVLFVSLGEYRLGIYRVLAPDGPHSSHTEWSKSAYQDWWASWHSAPLGAAVYLAIGTFGIYFIIIMNLAGGRVLLALWRLRKALRYQADIFNRDGFFGWKAARAVLVPTYTAILIHGISLILVSLALSQPLGFWVLAPVLLQWMLTLPFYLGLPPALTRRGVSSFKARQLARLSLSLRQVEAMEASLRAQGRFHTECEAIAQQIRRVASLRSMPFSRPLDLIFAILQLLATIGGVYSLIVLWY
ncbi:hypothetical protein ACWDFL_38070 [Streptomyces bungoensis]